MSMWNHLQSLCMKNKVLHEKVHALYQKSRFPYKIRSSFAEWIESQNWDQLDLTSENGRWQADRLYKELLSMIQAVEDRMQSSTSFDLEKTLDFIRAKETLKQEFEGNSCRFVEEVRKCLEDEQLLRFTSEDEALGHTKGRPEEPRAVENKEIKQKLDILKQKFLAAESALRDLEVHQNDFLMQYRQLQASICHLESQLTSGHLVDVQQNDVLNSKKNLENDKEQLALNTLERRNAMIDTHIRLAIDEANILQMIWQEISKWHLEQKQAITGLVQPRKGSLEVLDRICDQGGELLYRMIQQVEQLLVLLNKVNFQDDRKKQQIQIVLKELASDYLPMHLRKTFIVEQNIPDRILKVGSGRSANFSMAVRILGGKAFGLDFSKPRVKMALFFEKDIPAGDTFVQGACEIINGDEKIFTVHHSNNACVAQFYSIQLRNVKRPDRGRNEELVTDQKFAFVFFTTISICNKPIHLKVISLPVILTSQTSQEIMAKGTLIWDAAYSDENRTPFQYREMVTWREVAAVLNALFLQFTGRGLTEDHLHYLAKMAFRERNNINFNDMVISEKQLIKDKLPQRDFSFWKWFWANLNLVKDRIKKEWQDGSIYGFISKDDVRNKLMEMEPGTFLLRFSETNIEVSQRSDVSGFLTLSFVERDPATGQKKLFHVKDYLTPKEIQEKSLPTILNAMEVAEYMNPSQKKQLLRFLWPNKFFENVFSSGSCGQDPGDASNGYLGGKIRIEIFLTESPNRRVRQDSTDSSCPPSPQSNASTPFSPMNPPLSTITETMDDMGDEDPNQIEISTPLLIRPMATVIPQPIFEGTSGHPGQHVPLTHLPVSTAYPLTGSPQSLLGSYFDDLDIDAESLLTRTLSQLQHGPTSYDRMSLRIDSDGDLVMRPPRN